MSRPRGEARRAASRLMRHSCGVSAAGEARSRKASARPARRIIRRWPAASSWASRVASRPEAGSPRPAAGARSGPPAPAARGGAGAGGGGGGGGGGRGRGGGGGGGGGVLFFFFFLNTKRFWHIVRAGAGRRPRSG